MRMPGSALSLRRAEPLETVWVEVPEPALDAYEAALSAHCETVGFFFADEASRTWRVEGVREAGARTVDLLAALALAEAMTGVAAPLHREATQAEGWLARTYAGFPEQLVGRRFVVRGTHLDAAPIPGRIALTLDAGVAFGSGEHGSTRGCLRALERLGHARSGRPPRRILDLGAGSGILAIAAARLLRRPVLATDIEPWSVRTAAANARANGVGRLVRVRLANGWHGPTLRRAAPYDLVLANILARPLCRMSRSLALHLAPGGFAVLAGLLRSQARMVEAAHRRHGLHTLFSVREGEWMTLALRKRF